MRGAAKGCTCSVESGVVEADGDDALGLLLDLEAQVQTLARQDLDAAEVDVGTDRVRLGLVEGPGGRAVLGRDSGWSRLSVGCRVAHALLLASCLIAGRAESAVAADAVGKLVDRDEAWRGRRA